MNSNNMIFPLSQGEPGVRGLPGPVGKPGPAVSVCSIFFIFSYLSASCEPSGGHEGRSIVPRIWVRPQLCAGHAKEGLTKHIGALGPPVNGGDQLTVIDYVGASGEKSQWDGKFSWYGANKLFQITALQVCPPPLSVSGDIPNDWAVL